MKIFVTSDTHFNHTNIIKYCNRLFTSVEEMNTCLIKNWNDTVTDDDIVIFCGDFCFARSSEKNETTIHLTSLLKGHKIIIKGNHDFRQLKYTKCGWDAEYFQELVLFNRLCFRHVPGDQNPETWRYDNLDIDAKKYDYVFYGHVHDKTLTNAPANFINVCGDVNDFRPIDITNYFTSDELISIQKLIKMD